MRMAVAALCGASALAMTSAPPPTMSPPSPPSMAPPPTRLLAGKTIVIDPGHQLGNSAHPSEINRLVDAGGFQKACNSTGTSTDGGFPEATFAWEVALALRARLKAEGATVVLTRSTNSVDAWGPCVDARGRLGNRVDAALRSPFMVTGRIRRTAASS